MTDTIEETVEVLPVKLAINLNSPAGLVVVSLAAYGAKTLTTDVRRAVTKIRENRKAKKAAAEAQTQPQQ